MSGIHKLKKGIFSVGLVVACILSFTILFSLMSFSTPSQIGPAGVTIWFILALTALTSVFMLMFLARIYRRVGMHNQGQAMRAFRISIVPAGAIVILLGMSSLGTLGASDALLITGAVLIIELYLYSTDKRRA